MLKTIMELSNPIRHTGFDAGIFSLGGGGNVIFLFYCKHEYTLLLLLPLLFFKETNSLNLWKGGEEKGNYSIAT